MSFCWSEAIRREQMPWCSERMHRFSLKEIEEISLTLNNQYYKSSPLGWDDWLTLTSRRITLFFIPQSTATTFVGFPLPNTLTSCHFKNQRVRGKFQPWAAHQYHKHISGRFALKLVADWLLTIWEWLAVNQSATNASKCHDLYLFYEKKYFVIIYKILMPIIIMIPKKLAASTVNNHLSHVLLTNKQ